MPRYKLRTLMILLAILPPLLAWMSLPYFRRFSKQSVAKQRLTLLDNAVKLYCLDMGAPPSSLDDLLVLPQTINPEKWAGPYLEHRSPRLDPWGQPFGYKIIDGRQCQFRIWSNGSDKKPGTSDDLTYDF